MASDTHVLLQNNANHVYNILGKILGQTNENYGLKIGLFSADIWDFKLTMIEYSWVS